MDSRQTNHTKDQTSGVNDTWPALSDVTEVDVEPIGNPEEDRPVIPPERRLSWLGWGVAFMVFLVNRKVGIVFFILLLAFGKYPTLNLKNLSGSAGRLFKKLRS